MRTTATLPPSYKKKSRWRWVRRLFVLASTALLLLIVLLIVAAQLFLNRVPTTYRVMARQVSPPDADQYAERKLGGFESPYLGHTGSANGRGGTMFGRSKESDLDSEAAMGLRWTFLPVNWSAIERDRAVDMSPPNCFQTQQLDDFVIAARKRKLNILLQIVIGGNAGGPPDWAGRREKGKSAPANMTAAAAFARKLAQRYAPGGILSHREGWTDSFGVRAWELDNEPEGYRTNWNGQAGDYAEFATLSAAAIRTVDSRAMIAVAATAGGGNATPWLKAAMSAMDSGPLQGSPTFLKTSQYYNITQVADIISFHCYEGLETAFNRSDRTIVDDFSEVLELRSKYRTDRVPPNCDYWHTEGNFDFLGVLSSKRRAAWRFQFMTRAFAAGVSKVCVMDPSRDEQAAIKAYIAALPWPFPMKAATADVIVVSGQATAFFHRDSDDANAGRVWVVWPVANTGDARVQIPVIRDHVKVVGVDGTQTTVDASTSEHTVDVYLKGDPKMAAGVLVIDR